jgi:hypothetical protein
MLHPRNAHYIDAYIRDNMVELNHRGFHTFWSCSGLFEDHANADDYLFQSAYVCIKLDTIAPFLPQIAPRMNGEACYSATEWYTNLGHASSGMLKLEEMRMLNSRLSDSHLSQNMWNLEVDCLMNMEGQWDRPCLIIRPHNPHPIMRLSRKLQDEHLKLRWDRLFRVFLSLE